MTEPGPLEGRLAACARRWGVVDLEPLAGGHRSAVFAGVTAAGEDVVVKLPVTAAEFTAEAAALTAWAGDGAVELLDADGEEAALLMPRVWPGTHLPPRNEERAIAVAAELLGRLQQADVPAGMPTMAEAFDEWEARTRGDAEWVVMRGGPEPAGQRLLGLAGEAMARLSASSPGDVLLHGDFIDKNLLWDGRAYVAIDPIPRTGDPCSDIGLFASYHPVATGIVRRARRIATRMGHDPDRAACWAAVWSVGEACDDWRADTADLQAVVAGEEIDRLLRTA